ncbi:nucleotide exchange factor GrpE [Halobellus sp. EA9]|uniref:nucleotide exchange factor GrpE n=1 Tax=Halobellus sp. EA9 TaxID=3421647 RepID=UPI003EBCF6E5
MSDESPEGRTAAAEYSDADADADADADDEATDAQDADADVSDDAAPDEQADATPDADGAGSVDDPEESDLADRVAEYDEALADEVAALESRVADLESDLEDRDDRIEELESALKRSKADFKNYKKRAKKRQEEIRERATEDFVGRIVSVRDNLVRALDQDEDADIRPGVESTLEEFDRILDEEDVSAIEPAAGDDVDPTRHEVLMRVEDADQPEGTVVDVYRPGYEMAGSVVREAQVTVSDGSGADSDEDGEADEADAE